MLTILIPSNERPRYLKRAIAYWSMSEWPVFIADGSEEAMSFDGAPNIRYLHRPGVPLDQRLRELSASVSTPYAVLAADDDFVAFEALEHIMNFLDANPGYAAAQGLYTRFAPDSAGGEPHWFWDYRYASRFEFSDPSLERRVIAAVSAPVMHYCYSVVRATALRKTVTLLEGVTDTAASTVELTFNVGLMTVGHFATLPVFYAAREAHPVNWGTAMDIDEWLTKGSKAGSARWRRNLVGLYAAEHQIPEDEARTLVDRVVSTYLAGYRAKRARGPKQKKEASRQRIHSGIRQRLAVPARYLLGGAWRATVRLKVLGQMLGWDLKQHAAFHLGWRRMKKVMARVPVSGVLQDDFPSPIPSSATLIR